MQADRLVIFTRFPAPGRAKTRLIPAMGARGAAALQEIMTGRTVLEARTWAARSGAQLELRYTGAPAHAFRRWLGPDMRYADQGHGNLGARMARAVREAFSTGVRRIVLVGCDCPAMDADVLTRAYAALDNADVVIDPATDGGYVLLGMSAPHPELFDRIAWGTDTVRADTRAAAERRRLRVRELPPLVDVDIPGDLAAWEPFARAPNPDGLSVIIAALEEAPEIAACVRAAGPGAQEVIVVDGGSCDATRDEARRAGARVINAPRGRARQMNAGALAARGGLLLFVHADTRLPAEAAAAVRSTLRSATTVAGAFRLRIDAPEKAYRAIEAAVRIRCRLLARPYGDQAIFLRRDTFLRMGGYADLPVMEDLDLVCRLGRRGRVRVLPDPVHTSARLWRERGILRTTLLYQGLLLARAVGVSYDRLARWRG